MKLPKRMFDFLKQHFALFEKGKCMQGCGTKIKPGQFFCSDVCRHLYDIRTWGEGRRPLELTQPLKKSLQIATNNKNAVKAFRKARKQEVSQ